MLESPYLVIQCVNVPFQELLLLHIKVLLLGQGPYLSLLEPFVSIVIFKVMLHPDVEGCANCQIECSYISRLRLERWVNNLQTI